VDARNFPLPESTENMGYSKDFSFAFGVGGAEGRGHATFYATYREVDPVLEAKLDYSACTLNLSISGTNYTCGGSQTSDPTGFFNILPDGSGLATSAACPGSGCIIGTGGVLRPFTAADAYNFGPVNYFMRPDERYTAGVFADFKLSEKADVYGELMFMDDRSVAQIAPSGSFFGQHSVSCSNPLWTPQMVQEFCTNLGLTATDSATLSSVAVTRKVADARTTSVTSRIASSRASVASSTTS